MSLETTDIPRNEMFRANSGWIVHRVTRTSECFNRLENRSVPTTLKYFLDNPGWKNSLCMIKKSLDFERPGCRSTFPTKFHPRIPRNFKSYQNSIQLPVKILYRCARGNWIVRNLFFLRRFPTRSKFSRMINRPQETWLVRIGVSFPTSHAPSVFGGPKETFSAWKNTRSH